MCLDIRINKPCIVASEHYYLHLCVHLYSALVFLIVSILLKSGCITPSVVYKYGMSLSYLVENVTFHRDFLALLQYKKHSVTM